LLRPDAGLPKVGRDLGAGLQQVLSVRVGRHQPLDHAQRGGQLSHGEKPWLEIGILVVQEPKLLLLYGPVAI
jgi:ABC-type uncharacterized transport system ATPase subunit